MSWQLFVQTRAEVWNKWHRATIHLPQDDAVLNSAAENWQAVMSSHDNRLLLAWRTLKRKVTSTAT